MNYPFAFATLILSTIAVAGCSGDSGGPTSPSGTSSNTTAGTSTAAATPGTGTSGLGGTTSVVGTGLVGTVGSIVPATVSVLPTVTAATGSALGTPLTSGALLTTDGVGSGTTGILSAGTTTPNGTTNGLNVNVPSPILANTAVLPSGVNGGALVQIGGATTNGVTSTTGGLVNGLTTSVPSGTGVLGGVIH
jgi:hypothetical protein